MHNTQLTSLHLQNILYLISL